MTCSAVKCFQKFLKSLYSAYRLAQPIAIAGGTPSYPPPDSKLFMGPFSLLSIISFFPYPFNPVPANTLEHHKYLCHFGS